MRNSKGFIYPYKVYIKFHYDKNHGHVFCAIVNKVKALYPFNNKQKQYFDEMMTIVTDE